MGIKIQKTPLHIQVYNIIKHKLLTGELLPGERVVESRITQELGISNSPVREGLRMLEQERILV
ncbi:MAG: GntR family transcriptional regulator, partial [Gracilibacteraceae bacterium]|nr:GntR family transcriptional regulator [Gracilibacteraceae bacterium]